MYSMGDVGYGIIADDQTKAGTDSAIQNFQRVDNQSVLTTANLAKVAAAFAAITALSAGAVMASDRVVGLERITSHAAVTQGVSTRAMYEYVQSLSNAADPQEEIGATMNYLSRTGLRMSDDLGSVYKTMDQIGDATDQTSTAIAQQLIPAFQALGMKSQDVAKYADMLTYAYQNSLFEISDWTMMLRSNGAALLQYNIPLEDTIAISARLSALGIPSRQIMTLMNEAFKDMGANAAIAAKGEEELVSVNEKLLAIQEKINTAQDDGAKSSRHYLEDMQNAGRDVGKMRQLTLAYNSQQKDAAEDEAKRQKELGIEKAKLLSEQKIIQDKIAVAKNAPQESLIEAVVKQRPNQLTVAGLTADIENYKNLSTGAAAKYAPAGEIATGSEIAADNLDQLSQAVGKGISAEQAAGTKYLMEISAAITTASGILLLIQGFSQLTAIATVSTAAGGGIGSTPILAGLLLGGAGVAGMEAMGITSLLGDISGKPTGAIEKLGSNFQSQGQDVLDPAGARLREVNAYLRYTGASKEDKTRWATSRDITDADREKYKGKIMGYYAAGGIVPGAIGAPQMAIVHGGERIIPAGQSGGNGDFSVTIGSVTLTKDYPFLTMMKDIENYQQTKRKQLGVRTS
jgi:hypothetical protein